jgi:hypothetical protein
VDAGASSGVEACAKEGVPAPELPPRPTLHRAPHERQRCGGGTVASCVRTGSKFYIPIHPERGPRYSECL